MAMHDISNPRKEIKSTAMGAQAHEWVMSDGGRNEFERALIYLLEITSDVRKGDTALFVCGQVREACAMKLAELARAR